MKFSSCATICVCIHLRIHALRLCKWKSLWRVLGACEYMSTGSGEVAGFFLAPAFLCLTAPAAAGIGPPDSNHRHRYQSCTRLSKNSLNRTYHVNIQRDHRIPFKSPPHALRSPPPAIDVSPAYTPISVLVLTFSPGTFAEWAHRGV